MCLSVEKKNIKILAQFFKFSLFCFFFFFHSGLGPSPLHQTLPPGYLPSLPGSMPPPYQFTRDPQSGQLIVISTEHLPHYGTKAAARLREHSSIWGRRKARLHNTPAASQIWRASAETRWKQEGFSSWGKTKQISHKRLLDFPQVHTSTS